MTTDTGGIPSARAIELDADDSDDEAFEPLDEPLGKRAWTSFTPGTNPAAMAPPPMKSSCMPTDHCRATARAGSSSDPGSHAAASIRTRTPRTPGTSINATWPVSPSPPGRPAPRLHHRRPHPVPLAPSTSPTNSASLRAVEGTGPRAAPVEPALLPARSRARIHRTDSWPAPMSPEPAVAASPADEAQAAGPIPASACLTSPPRCARTHSSPHTPIGARLSRKVFWTGRYSPSPLEGKGGDGGEIRGLPPT